MAVALEGLALVGLLFESFVELVELLFEWFVELFGLIFEWFVELVGLIFELVEYVAVVQQPFDLAHLSQAQSGARHYSAS